MATMEQEARRKETASAGLTGSLSGAATGASLGSAVPVVGTAVGAVVGALVGGIGSAVRTNRAMKSQAQFEADQEKAFREQQKMLEAANREADAEAARAKRSSGDVRINSMQAHEDAVAALTTSTVFDGWHATKFGA